MRPVFGFAATALLLATSSVFAQQITSVPDNAAVVIKFNNLDKVNQKVGVLAQHWGLAALQPMAADPLTALEGYTNIKQGVNRAGEAAVIIFNQQRRGRMSGPPVLVMVPVTDYAAFLKNFPDAETKGEITSVTLPGEDLGYVANWNGFAAISPNRALVATKPTAVKVAGLAAEEFAKKDVVAYINFKSFKMEAAQGLSFGRMMLIGQVDQQLGRDPAKAKFAPMAKVAVQQFFSGLDHFMNETQSMTIGLDLSNEGVRITKIAEFAPESYLGGLVKKWQAPAADFAGIPQGQYAAVSSVTLDSAVLQQVLNDAAGPVLAEADKLGDDGKPMVEYFNAIKKLWSVSKGQVFAISAGEGEPGKTPLVDVVTVVKGDADQIIAAQQQMIAQQDRLQDLAKLAGQTPTKATYQQAVKTVNGVKLDQFTTSVASDQKSMNHQQEEMIKAIYGEGGFSMLMGKVNPQTLVATTSRDDQKIGALIDAASKNQVTVASDPQSKQVAARLPQRNFFSLFIYGDPFLKVVNRGSILFTGIPIQMQLPPNSLPIGMAASTEGSAIKTELFLPSSLVQSVIAASMQEAVRQQQQEKTGGGL